MIGCVYNNPVRQTRPEFRLWAYKSASQLAFKKDPGSLAALYRRAQEVCAKQSSAVVGKPNNAWDVNFNNGNVNNNDVNNNNRVRCLR